MKKKKEITWEEIKAMNAETAKILNEDRKQAREDRKQAREDRKQAREDRKQAREERKKMKESHEDFMKRMEKLEKLFAQTREQIGGISRSNGEFCEEYFINAFKENPTFLGEKYDRVVEYLKPDPAVVDDEYDLILRNGSTVALIEMKYKAGLNDVGKMFSKLHSYRLNYPMFKDYKTYLALASFRFSKAVREKAEKEGVVLIQQRGEKIEVISENIRAWY